MSKPNPQTETLRLEDQEIEEDWDFITVNVDHNPEVLRAIRKFIESKVKVAQVELLDRLEGLISEKEHKLVMASGNQHENGKTIGARIKELHWAKRKIAAERERIEKDSLQ
ncbi:MAG: hypothetical protein QME66_04260 [Candidatus Eisenbacteria bacterium]|nr:hypothetical protein [Candidatus Eisenbacteria bacterium]